MDSIKTIGIAEMDIVASPGQIGTLGLGSCVGLVLYDRVTKIAGMVHVLLPVPPQTLQGPLNKAKFASLGVPELLNRMLQMGASRPNIAAKMAGGAHMFGNLNTTIEILRVGERNVKECREALLRLRIPLLAEDTLGQYGRTIYFHTATGMLHIKTVGYGSKEI